MANLTIEVAQEHLALLSSIVSSYDGLIAGQIGNNNLTQEDYSQIDRDDMELIDIQWAMSSIVQRAKGVHAEDG